MAGIYRGRFEISAHKPSKPLAVPGGSRKKQNGWAINRDREGLICKFAPFAQK